MLKYFPLRLRSAAYALRGGFLIRPSIIALVLGTCGAVFSSIEETHFWLASWVPHTLFPSSADPQVAQSILGVIATSTMTVVSIVFAILLMTLTLASMQFSPRILISFSRDRTTQWTLGIFLGTFAYCLAAMPAARSVPHPVSPVATLAIAMLLAGLCIGALLFFIQHISQAISVNHIVDRIARETELVIDTLMPHHRKGHRGIELESVSRSEAEIPILSEVSGYVRFIDIPKLVEFARSHQFQVRVTRKVGQFVPQGVPLIMVSRRSRVDHQRAVELTAAFDIGPMRTLQQDVEFGVIQIVDIALRAISPAVNDPSTAISCIDQLARILILWMSRFPPDTHYYQPRQVLRVTVPWIDADDLLDTAIEQIRSYSAGDFAVSRRLLRLLEDVVSTVQDERLRAVLVMRGERVIQGCRSNLPGEDVVRLEHAMRRLSQNGCLRHSLDQAGRFQVPD